MSNIHQCSDCLEMAVAALNKQVLGYRLPNNWLLLLSNDLVTLEVKQGFIWTYVFGSLTSSNVVFPPLPWLPNTPNQPKYTINQPKVSTCGVDEKLWVIQLATLLRVHEPKYLWWLYNGVELHGSIFEIWFHK